MKHTTVKFGNKSVRLSYDPFADSGHTDYSGFGPHGKSGYAKNRQARRDRKREERDVRNGRYDDEKF